jgi:PKD repeat protein
MKHIFSTLLLGFCLTAYCQTLNHDWCGSDHRFYNAMANNAQIQIEYDNFNLFVEEHGDEFVSERAVKIVPVVVHIIHNYGSENISDAQVADAIRFLNEDYLGTSSDLSSVIPSFSGIVDNPQFEFRLATLDPNGNCTNGITRRQSLYTVDAEDEAKFDVWPRNKYYNIWVVANIYSDTPGLVTAGYSYFPSNFQDPATDGTLIGFQYFGNNSTPFQKRVLSHETGHWFNLKHTFGNVSVDQGDCSGTDNVSDTPKTPGSLSTCNLARNDCSGALANVQNIMDYSSCTNMFTQGQAARMITAINSATGERSSLSTGSNLTATGTSTLTVSNCAPVADFHANRYSVCAGTTITFFDNSWNAVVTSRLWTFTDGITTINDTSASPVITFTNPGVYDVTLTASSAAGNDVETRTDYIYVFDGGTAQVTTPMVEDCESGPISSGLWSVLYSLDPTDGWQVTGNAHVSGTKAFMVHNYAVPGGTQLIMYSPSYDFTTIGTPITMTFKYAYAQRDAANADVLKIWGSTNCGQNWQLRATYDAAALSTGGIKTTDWYPNSGQWGTKTVSTLSAYVNKPNVRFKFEFLTDNGNNLFIDDINITGALGLEDVANNELEMNLYPNPVQNEFNVDFYVDKNYDATFRLVDLAGKQLSVLGVKELVAGDNHYVFTVPAGTTKGLYFFQMDAGGKTFTHKIIIE